jgi:hypothetical protein
MPLHVSTVVVPQGLFAILFPMTLIASVIPLILINVVVLVNAFTVTKEAQPLFKVTLRLIPLSDFFSAMRANNLALAVGFTETIVLIKD